MGHGYQSCHVAQQEVQGMIGSTAMIHSLFTLLAGDMGSSAPCHAFLSIVSKAAYSRWSRRSPILPGSATSRWSRNQSILYYFDDFCVAACRP